MTVKPPTKKNIYSEARSEEHYLQIRDDMRGRSPEERLIAARHEAEEQRRQLASELWKTRRREGRNEP